MQNGPISDLVAKVSSIILDPFIALVFAASVLVFMYGVAEFLYNINVGGGDGKEGKKHMVWGIIGIFIMTAAWTLIRIIDATIGSNYVH